MYLNFILIFFLSLGLLSVFVKLAGQLGFVAIPNNRSSHVQATPSSSGIVFFAAAVIVQLFNDFSIFQNYGISILATLLVFLLGAADDLKDHPARYKLYVIAVAAILASWNGFLITNIGTYFSYTVPLAWIALPFTIIFILGFTNALNLIDGLDGLAGTISIIILSSLWFIGYQNNDSLLMGVTVLIIPALLAFLVYNWSPAKVFMGDSGSLTLGFVISLLSIKALDYVNPVVILYLLAFPIIDTLVIMTRRKKYGRPIFAPCKNHAHHIFINLFKGNVKRTVIVLALIQVVYSLVGITLVTTLPQEVTLLFFLVNLVIWYWVLTSLCEKHPRLVMQHQLENIPQTKLNEPR